MQPGNRSTSVPGEVLKNEIVPGPAGSSGGTRRSSGQGWTSTLAPRFERRAAAEAEQKHIYYEGEFCEAEELPNGFTKIRCVNHVKYNSFLELEIQKITGTISLKANNC